MKSKVLNILTIVFLIISGVFGAFAPVSAAISYYMLLGGFLVGAAKLAYQYYKSFKEKDYMSGEAFSVIAATILFFMNKEIEAVAFMTIVVIALEVLEYIYGKVDRKIRKIESYLPQKAVIFKDGEETEIDARELEIGNIVIVNSYEKIPADGVVFRGSSLLDGKYFNIDTPCEAKKDDVVLAGYVNTGETLQIEVTKTWEESFFNKCIKTSEEAAKGVSSLEVRFKLYEKILTIMVILVTAAIALGMVFVSGAEVSSAVMIAVVAASSVVLYNPSKVSGKSTASFIYDKLEEGVVLKNRDACSKISKIEGLILEDDGRLAEGEYELLSIVENEGITKEEILTYAAHLKYFSKSNLSKAVVKAYQQLAKYEGLNEETAIKYTAVSHIEELPGKGVTGKVAGKFVCAGNDKLMALLNISELPTSEGHTMVHVAVNQNYIGSLVLKYVPKEGMEDVLSYWNLNGINNYAVDKGNFEVIAEELREASSENGTIAYVATKADKKKKELVDVVSVIDVIESKEFVEADILCGTNDLKKVAKLKKEISEKTGNLKVQGIVLLVFKTLCYGVAAATGVNILVPTAIDALITIFYGKINI